MPSAEPAQRWQAMSMQLVQAAQDQDWERLLRLDQMLSQWLTGAAPDQLERAVMQPLIQAHQQALALCQMARQEAAQQLHTLQQQQEAQKAYAWQEALG